MQFLCKAAVLLAAICAAAPLDHEKKASALAPIIDIDGLAVGDVSLFFHQNKPREAPNLQIGLGNTKTHIGNLVGPSLYNQIWLKLDALCPPGSESCTSGSKHFQIKTLEGDLVKNLVIGALEIQVERSHYGKNDALRRLLIGTAATAFSTETDISTNCYKTSWGARAKNTVNFCNIGDRVEVGVKGTDSYLWVKVKASSSPISGKFDCVGGLTLINGAVDTLLPEYKQVLGYKEMTRNVFCLNKGVTRSD